MESPRLAARPLGVTAIARLPSQPMPEPSHPASPPALEVAVRKRFPMRADSGFALDVRFSIPAGIAILFGASGAGKTTTLECIAGLLAPDQGCIRASENVLFDSAAGINLDPARRSVGYVFQDIALFPHLTVAQNVAYGLARLPKQDRERRVSEALESFRIDSLRGRLPAEISGGERQRTALARALVTRPSVLLLDEPLAALDAATKSRIVDDLRSWNRARRIPILYVTHSREEVFALGERVLVLEQGRLAAAGLPQEVFAAPLAETVAQLAGFENIFDACVTATRDDAGTMTCRLGSAAIELEVPLSRIDPGALLRLGIRAGDILLAITEPHGLSARNVLAGTLTALEEKDFKVLAQVDCGVSFRVLLTPAARRSLALEPGRPVWLIVKTHSCHLFQQTNR